MIESCLRPSWDISQYLEALVKQCRFHEARLYQFERTNQLRQHFYNLSKEDPNNILVTPTHRRQRLTGLDLKRSFDDSVDVTPLWEAAQLQDLLHTGCDPRLKFLIFLGTKLHSHHPDTPSKIAKGFYGDLGSLSNKLFQFLQGQGVELTTKLRKNIEPGFLMIDRILLKKRTLIETVNDQIKNIYQIEQFRHRSPINACVHLLAGLTAYTQQGEQSAFSWTAKD